VITTYGKIFSEPAHAGSSRVINSLRRRGRGILLDNCWAVCNQQNEQRKLRQEKKIILRTAQNYYKRTKKKKKGLPENWEKSMPQDVFISCFDSAGLSPRLQPISVRYFPRETGSPLYSKTQLFSIWTCTGAKPLADTILKVL